MPPRKRKAIGQVQPKAKKSKQQRRQETPEERNGRLALLRKRATGASKTVQRREVRLQDNRDGTAKNRTLKAVKQCEVRLQAIRNTATKSKASETVQECEARLQDIRDRDTNRKASWKLKRCEVRLQDINTATKSKASETLQESKFQLHDIKDRVTNSKASWTLKRCEVRLQDIRNTATKSKASKTIKQCEVQLHGRSSASRASEMVQEISPKEKIINAMRAVLQFEDECSRGMETQEMEKRTEVFICAECGMTFKIRELWQIHLRKHEHQPESWFSCNGCGIAYQQMSALKRHLKFRCSHAKRGRLCNESKLYSCMKCRMFFKKKCSLETHNLQFHSQDGASLSDGSNSFENYITDILSTNLDDSQPNVIIHKKDWGYELSSKAEASSDGLVSVKKENLHFESEFENQYKSMESSSSPSDILVQSQNQIIKTESEKSEFNINKPFPELCDISDKEFKENVGEITSRFSTALNKHSGESHHINSGTTQSVLPLGDIGEQETDQIDSGNEHCEDQSEETWSSCVAVWTGLV